MRSVAAPPLSERSWVRQFDGLRWVDGANRMFEDDLRTTASRKLDRVVVERSDLTLEPDSIG
jgi:hypothetical protein